MSDSLKVMIVDDEPELVSALTDRLRLRGIEADGVMRGEVALERLALRGPYDVVVLDVKMPGLGGLETLRRIRKTHPDLPVLLLTGHGCNEDRLVGMELGARECLIKPLDIDVLVAKMREAATEKVEQP